MSAHRAVRSSLRSATRSISRHASNSSQRGCSEGPARRGVADSRYPVVTSPDDRGSGPHPRAGTPYRRSCRPRLPAGFEAAVAGGAEALVVLPNAMFWNERARIAALAARHRLPAIYEDRGYAIDGGLLSYGRDVSEQFRLTAGYVDKILKGAKPSDLPIQQPTRFQLVVNRKTAKALGLTIPPSILDLADEVIE